MSDSIADAIVIRAATQHLADKFASNDDKFAFAYHITITNQSIETVQLLSRYWLITDGDGKQTEVRGDGVVGEQPIIEAGQSYEYTSGALLDTPVGNMQGYYVLQILSGENQGTTFQAPIDVFTLAVPSSLN